MNIIKYLPVRILLLVTVAAGLVGLVRLVHQPDDPDRQVVRKTRHLMGTLWEIQVVPERAHSQEFTQEMIFSAFNEIDRIEKIMSEWISDSPISTVNKSAGGAGPACPGELISIIERGIEYGDLTAGVFDITWRGLTGIWKYGDDFLPPSPEQIEKARQLVDYRRIQVNESKVTLPENFAIGLGGIAKGYAVDRAASVLKKAGINNFLVNGGGDIITSGQSVDILTSGQRVTRPWTIGVQSPRGGRDELVARVDVSNRAVVTSGDYERFQMYQGIRYHHILDPRTGEPARGTQSVTLVASTAEEADVLATAVFILGPEKGLQLVSNRETTEALVIDENGKFWFTAGFREIAEFF